MLLCVCGLAVWTFTFAGAPVGAVRARAWTRGHGDDGDADELARVRSRLLKTKILPRVPYPVVECPVVGGGYHSMRVAGFRLMNAGRIGEATACFQASVSLFLSRVAAFPANPQQAQGPEAEKARKKIGAVVEMEKNAGRENEARALRISPEQELERRKLKERADRLAQLADNEAGNGDDGDDGDDEGAAEKRARARAAVRPDQLFEDEEERALTADEYARQLARQKDVFVLGL